MFKKLEKHKIFCLVVFALVMLLMGVSFSMASFNPENSDAATYSYDFYFLADWYNGEKYHVSNSNIVGPPVYDPEDYKYENNRGDKFDFNIGKVEFSATATIEQNDGVWHVYSENDSEWLGWHEGVVDGFVTTQSTSGLSMKVQISDNIGHVWEHTIGKLNVSATATILEDGFEFYSIDTVGFTSDSATATTATATYSDTREIGFTWGEGSASPSYKVTFAPKMATRTFDPDGGNWNGSTRTIDRTERYLNYYSEPVPDPTREGYTFRGWAYVPNAYETTSGGAYGEGVFMGGWTDDILYAKWQRNEYNVTLNHNGGTDTDGAPNDSSTIKATYNSTLPTLNAKQIPTKAGHAFGGFWSEDGKTQYYDKDGNGLRICDFTSAKTIYAKWMKVSYTITFDDMGSQEVIYKSTDYSAWKYPTEIYAVGATSNIPEKTGYTFEGWWTAESGGTQIFNASGNPVERTSYIDSRDIWTYQGDLTVYAQWTEHTYTIIFDKNSTEASGSMSDMSLSYTESKALTTNAFTRTGYTFTGWATSDSGAVVYSDRATVCGLTSVDGGTVNLYAVWSENSYTIAFNNNGGSGTITSKTLTYTESWTLTINTFIKAGYLFEKWNAKSDGTGSNYLDGASVSKLSSINGATVTLYAKWQSTWAIEVATPSGSGTEADPYQISSVKNLSWIASQTTGTTAFNKHCKQTANISLSGKVWLPIGTSRAKFTGSYDGNGYVITNINSSTIKNASNNYIYSQIGLFGYTSGATINRVTILSSTMYGHNQVGVLVGSANDSTKISMCQTKGTVTISGQYAGGICGDLSSSSSLTKSVSSATVNGGKNAGGLVGYAGLVTITSSGFTGTVSGTDCALLVGYASKDYSAGPTITDCFAHGTGSTSFYKGSGAKSITSCLYSSGTTKKYYDGAFTGWVKIGSTTIPKDLAWITSIGESTAKSTIINGYSKVA